MKKIALIILSVAMVTSTFYCKSSSKSAEARIRQKSNTAQYAQFWGGSYLGFLPCADCDGILTTITLDNNMNYRLKLKYLGKPGSAYISRGKFSWTGGGNVIVLDTAGYGLQFAVAQGMLTQLNRYGDMDTGELAEKYILTRENYLLVEKRWQLIELQGVPVSASYGLQKGPYVVFMEGDNRFKGYGGCNTFGGTYELKYMNRITVSNAISTQMACPALETESAMLKVIQTADNFEIDGDVLLLHKESMQPLAKFKAVDSK
jgi:heat shock protein HslJ